VRPGVNGVQLKHDGEELWIRQQKQKQPQKQTKALMADDYALFT
jgi:hypothetical protein